MSKNSQLKNLMSDLTLSSDENEEKHVSEFKVESN